jgi:hypothetical protein
MEKTKPNRDTEFSAERRLAGFMSRFSPEVARTAKAARARIRTLLPESFELVYDNYNALALAFSPSERASDAILSIALYPRWVSLFFARGKGLPDPHGILSGSGNKMRHVVLETPKVIGSKAVLELIAAAVVAHPKPLGPERGTTIIKWVSAKQRPRRP